MKILLEQEYCKSRAEKVKRAARLSPPGPSWRGISRAVTVAFFWVECAHRAHFLHGAIHPRGSAAGMNGDRQ